MKPMQRIHSPAVLYTVEQVIQAETQRINYNVPLFEFVALMYDFHGPNALMGLGLEFET